MINLNVDEIGIMQKGCGIPILCLHSSASSKSQWRYFQNYTIKNYRTISVDLMGYGKTPLICSYNNYNLYKEIELIKVVIDKFIGNQPFYLVGHSYGGTIALKYATIFQKNIISLILYEPILFHLLHCLNDNSFSIIMNIVNNISKLIKKGELLKASKIFFDFWCGENEFDKQSPLTKTIIANQIYKINFDYKALLSDIVQIEQTDLSTIKLFLIYGDKSPEILKRMMKLIGLKRRNTIQVVVNGDHMFPISKPKEMAFIITSLLKDT